MALGVLVCAVALGLSAPSASAAPTTPAAPSGPAQPDPSVVGKPPQAAYTPHGPILRPSARPANVTPAIGGGYAGCTVRTLLPHASSHQPGTVNAGLMSTCDWAQPSLTQTAQLWETRWWGWNMIGDPGFDSVFNFTEQRTYSNSTFCNNTMTTRVTGTGTIVFDNGQTDSETLNSEPGIQINNCP